MLFRSSFVALLLAAAEGVRAAGTSATRRSRLGKRQDYGECRKTQVAILGAGVAGISAAQALANQSVTDFLIVEYKGEIGGRMTNTDFGKQPDSGDPYKVELGANWVQGLGVEGGPENPVWTFAKKWNVTNTYSNYSSILTYNETGEVDYAYLFDELDEAYTTMEQDAGYILTENLQDRTGRAGFSLAGWRPSKAEMPMAAQAIEWFYWDWELAGTPEETSQLYGITNYNLTFYQWSDENNFVVEPEGFAKWLKGEASTFLKEDDPRLLLNTIVTNITYADDGVTVYNDDGSCIEAEYAVNTFSLGVMQNDVVTFEPELPKWKETALEMFEMGTYTKIFYQFNETFWDTETQFHLYADPTTRGYFPAWQSLDCEGFLPGSGIIFATVTGSESYRVENQDDETTMKEGLEVLRKMFPDADIPEPIAFMYPRWTTQPWAYGSYSNWPIGTTLEMHQNIRANLDRLFFAGEYTSSSYFGFLHGAWFEGREMGSKIAGMLGAECVNGNYTNIGNGSLSTSGVDCGPEPHYEVLTGTTEISDYSSENGWDVSSFLTYGLEEED